MTKRQELLSATKELLWERGYEGTSPAAILERSGAGQGSLYHHFDGKRGVALAALADVEEELTAHAIHYLDDPDRPGLERIERWLTAPRESLRGCRLGRLAQEQAVHLDDGMRGAIGRYFDTTRNLLETALRDAVAAKQLAPIASVEAIASTLLATVQGGYVLARAANSTDAFERCVEGARQLLTILPRP